MSIEIRNGTLETGNLTEVGEDGRLEYLFSRFVVFRLQEYLVFFDLLILVFKVFEKIWI